MKKQRLTAEKRRYLEWVLQYMYDNHISFRTLKDDTATGWDWREHRAYDAAIENELVEQSKLFLNLLDKELNVDFRKRLAHFMAIYLSVYVAKSSQYASCKDIAKRQNKAMLTLKNHLVEKLNKDEEAKKYRKTARKKSASKPMTLPTSKPLIEMRASYSICRNGSVIQKIIFRGKSHTKIYPNIEAYNRGRDEYTTQITAKYHNNGR